MSDDDRPIALIGLMGAGKSVVAVRLGERMGAPVTDLDALIEAESGHSIANLFEREGEVAFRRRESGLLDRALVSGARVIACGGGLVVDPMVRSQLRRSCRVVWLEVTPAEAARRVVGTRASRPLLGEGDVSHRLGELLEQRRAWYTEAAQVRVPTDGRSPEAVADAVLAALRDA